MFKTNPRTGISSNYINSISLEKKLKLYEDVLNIAENINLSNDNYDEDKLINLLIKTSLLAKKMKFRSQEVINIEDELYKLGSIYCKQLGAGGGGFIFSLFDTENPNIPKNLREKMIRPKISNEGIKILK